MKYGLILMVLFSTGCMIPGELVMPVKNATPHDWNKESFWYYPWGESVVHKGIDIFAEQGTEVFSSTNGVVLFAKENGRGGKSVFVMGPLCRFYYYAHLDSIITEKWDIVRRGDAIGLVGTTGNAQGKLPHLHYAIATPIPYVWRFDFTSKQGWRKMFYLDPGKELVQ